jgi:hypothetical protein
MEHKTLTNLFSERIFNIPEYQRGYAWEEKQWKDFAEDVDALTSEEEGIRKHYTGTIVTYCDHNAPPIGYGSIEKLRSVDVVDGQQRLTTSCLYLSVIIRGLIDRGKTEYERASEKYLYAGATPRLLPNNEANDLYLDLLKTGTPNTQANSTHKKRLVAAHEFFTRHAQPKTIDELVALYDAITSQLVFTYYTIEEECEIGMTFELMNSRGKDLSVLELLKNYLMHWVYKNVSEDERQSLTGIINKSWKETYTNIASGKGGEDRCLRVAWILYCNHAPKAWKGYAGFKHNDYFPLRTFTGKRPKEVVKTKLFKFVDGLAKVSKDYADITNPTDDNGILKDENKWLSKIHHTGNVTNFLPLIVAARMRYREGRLESDEYIRLLKALECYAYRVFLFDGRRSNAGKSSFYNWADGLFSGAYPIGSIIEWIHGLVRYYASEESFAKAIAEPDHWYGTRNLLKYTLFEYELFLLSSEGKGKAPSLKWKDLTDATIEHIYPQNPDERSHWKVVWSEEGVKTYLHDIGNLVLTQNNSNYSNFDFDRKKGKAGDGISYANSDIRQERKLADEGKYPDWTPKEAESRRLEISKWIVDRWKTQETVVLDTVDETEDLDSEEVDSQID